MLLEDLISIPMKVSRRAKRGDCLCREVCIEILLANILAIGSGRTEAGCADWRGETNVELRHWLTFCPVYNHVLRLNLVTRQWNLVDNYGDIPGVRMGTFNHPDNPNNAEMLI